MSILFKNKSKDYNLKRWHLYSFIIIIIMAGIIKLNSLRTPKAEVIIGDQTLKVLVADTPERRFKGWSNRDNMGKYDGMLFVFPAKGRYNLFPEKGKIAMVMREMRFPLDIIWLDEDFIVDIAPNLAPETGKSESELTPYLSRLPADKVLELSAGFAAQNGVKIGDRVEIREL